METVIVLSGGMDSATLAYWHKANGDDAICVSFNYGQRHKTELERAKVIAANLDYEHIIIDLSNMADAFTGSSLTDDSVDVPHGHYASENMKKTVVPSRNAIMLSIAHGIAVSKGMKAVSTGIHAGDHFIYPDCREDFFTKIKSALNSGIEGFSEPIDFIAPFMHLSKTDIARLGDNLGVDYANTWTCYEGGEVHCGKCGACTERQEAFRDAGVEDVTVYA